MSGLLAFLQHRAVVRTAQIVIGLVFAAAGLAKIGDLKSFAEQVHYFRMIPVWSENLVAMTLPWIELVAAGSLILGIRARAGGILVFAMMALFTIAVGQAFARGIDIECGCFGTSDGSTVGAKKLLENVGLTLVAWIATRRSA